MKLRSPWSPVALLALGLILSMALWACSDDSSPTSLTADSTEVEQSTDRGLSLRHPSLRPVIEIQERHTPDLLSRPGVVGTAVSFDESGNPHMVVYVVDETAQKAPLNIEGLPVRTVVSGPIVAFKGKPGGGGGTDPKVIQTPPIQLGTSGGPADDLANGYCCGGTLGALIEIGNSQYILSNSHVFAGDVVSGGNGTTSSINDDIIQPGLIDVGCNAGNGQIVADLSSLSTLYPPASTPNVDASIAQVRSGMVRTDGSILNIGTLSSQTVAASVRMGVKKMGRTSGLTRSTIDALNATVNVGYSDECAGGSFTKTFTGQIIIKNKGSKFLNSGDSGSLMVEDVDPNPRAVGLLFAGSSTTAVANPIGDVLSHFNASMVGN